MSDHTKFSNLSQKDRALIKELGGGSKTMVSAQMVEALSGNGNAAIYLSQLLWWAKRKADEDGWFYRTREQMKERCGLGEQAQRTAEKTLKSMGLIETDLRGMPAKKHYRVHYSLIISVLADDAPEVAGNPDNKSSGVGGPTSCRGYPTQQVAGGRCHNPIENNKENNTERARTREGEGGMENTRFEQDSDEETASEDGPPIRENDPPGVEVWVDVTGKRPTIQTRENLKNAFTREEGPRWNAPVFRQTLREAYQNVDRDPRRIKIGYLMSSYKKKLSRGDSVPRADQVHVRPSSAQETRSDGDHVYSKPTNVKAAIR